MAVSPYHIREPVVDAPSRVLSTVWERWLRELLNHVNHAPIVAGHVAVRARATSLEASTPPLSAGFYRVSYAFRIVQAASANSRLVVRLEWTDGGVVLTHVFPEETGNTVNTVQSNILMVQVDGGTVITVFTDYTSVGDPAMRYQLDVVAEALP